MRADFHQEGGSGDWHTRLGQPKVVPVKIDVPVGLGYVLTSKKTGRMLAMVDLRFMQQELFKQLPKDAVAGRHAAAGRGARHDLLRQRGCDTVLPLGHVWRGHVGRRAAAVRAGHVSGSERGGRGRRRPADYAAAGAVLPRSAARPAVPRCARGAPSPGNAFPAWTKVPARTDDGAAATEQWGRRHRHRERRERSDRRELEERGAGVEAVRGRCRQCLLSPAERRAAAVVQPDALSPTSLNARVQLSGRAARCPRPPDRRRPGAARRRRVWCGDAGAADAVKPVAWWKRPADRTGTS